MNVLSIWVYVKYGIRRCFVHRYFDIVNSTRVFQHSNFSFEINGIFSSYNCICRMFKITQTHTQGSVVKKIFSTYYFALFQLHFHLIFVTAFISMFSHCIKTIIIYTRSLLMMSRILFVSVIHQTHSFLPLFDRNSWVWVKWYKIWRESPRAKESIIFKCMIDG